MTVFAPLKLPKGRRKTPLPRRGSVIVKFCEFALCSSLACDHYAVTHFGAELTALRRIIIFFLEDSYTSISKFSQIFLKFLLIGSGRSQLPQMARNVRGYTLAQWGGWSANVSSWLKRRCWLTALDNANFGRLMSVDIR